MRRSLIVVLLQLAVLAAGCSPSVSSSPSGEAAGSASPPSASAVPSPSVIERRPLPGGFPVLAGAVAVPMPADDPGLIGLWEGDQIGSAAFDFYVDALPTAGYPIVGLYPGGDVALIRFQGLDGEVWQVVTGVSGEGGTTIEVRVDRP